VVFFMAFNKRNKPVKLPPKRVLIHPFKTLKKRSYLILIPFILVAKKVKPKVAPQPFTCVFPPLHPKILLFILLLLVSI